MRKVTFANVLSQCSEFYEKEDSQTGSSQTSFKSSHAHPIGRQPLLIGIAILSSGRAEKQCGLYKVSIVKYTRGRRGEQLDSQASVTLQGQASMKCENKLMFTPAENSFTYQVV